MTQKTQKHGANDTRYFWVVSVKGEGKKAYRSRHATSTGVRSQFRRMGKTVIGISTLKM